MKPHKKHAYIAFGVAVGGQLIQSSLPLVQKVIVDDVITTQRATAGAVAHAARSRWASLVFVFAYIRRYRGGRIALDVQHDLRTAMFRQLQHARLRAVTTSCRRASS